jgi:hypothetical protein
MFLADELIQALRPHPVGKRLLYCSSCEFLFKQFHNRIQYTSLLRLFPFGTASTTACGSDDRRTRCDWDDRCARTTVPSGLGRGTSKTPMDVGRPRCALGRWTRNMKLTSGPALVCSGVLVSAANGRPSHAPHDGLPSSPISVV